MALVDSRGSCNGGLVWWVTHLPEAWLVARRDLWGRCWSFKVTAWCCLVYLVNVPNMIIYSTELKLTPTAEPAWELTVLREVCLQIVWFKVPPVQKVMKKIFSHIRICLFNFLNHVQSQFQFWMSQYKVASSNKCRLKDGSLPTTCDPASPQEVVIGTLSTFLGLWTINLVNKCAL